MKKRLTFVVSYVSPSWCIEVVRNVATDRRKFSGLSWRLGTQALDEGWVVAVEKEETINGRKLLYACYEFDSRSIYVHEEDNILTMELAFYQKYRAETHSKIHNEVAGSSRTSRIPRPSHRVHRTGVYHCVDVQGRCQSGQDGNQQSHPGMSRSLCSVCFFLWPNVTFDEKTGLVSGLVAGIQDWECLYPCHRPLSYFDCVLWLVITSLYTSPCQDKRDLGCLRFESHLLQPSITEHVPPSGDVDDTASNPFRGPNHSKFF